MQRYKIKIEYDGTPFVGWQFQKNGLSIQEVLQDAIFSFSQESVTVTGAGRTDSGVHAEQMFAQQNHVLLSKIAVLLSKAICSAETLFCSATAQQIC